MLNTLSSQIAISLENARHIKHVENLYHSTERFVPKRFLELLQRKNIEQIKLGDCLKLDISVLFTDIRKFTTLLEKLKPEDALTFVNRYWSITAPVIQKHYGFINQYQGDGLLAIFPRNSDDAVQAGIEMLFALIDFNKKQKERDEPQLEIGVGINSGPGIIGIVGVEERLEPAVVSDITNTASRVESLNKTYRTKFLITEATVTRLQSPEKYQIRIIDKVRLKGRTAATQLYEIINWEHQLQQTTIEDYKALYEKAFAEYEQGNFKSASKRLQECLAYRAGDYVVSILKQRCEEYINKGVPKGWDGTYVLAHK